MEEPETLIDEVTKAACEDFIAYHTAILSPTAEEVMGSLDGGQIRLHHAVQATMVTAHALDYLYAIRKAMKLEGGRHALVQAFDKNYAVEGARFLSHKFELIDAVNNAVKHISLDPNRSANKSIAARYGQITFRSLREADGIVLFDVGDYSFDFARVVLRPVMEVIGPVAFECADDAADFARGGCGPAIDVDDDDDPIDQMIDFCNPCCLDCAQPEDDCKCTTFLYAGVSGEFRPATDDTFDFDAVMSKISGAYSRA